MIMLIFPLAIFALLIVIGLLMVIVAAARGRSALAVLLSVGLGAGALLAVAAFFLLFSYNTVRHAGPQEIIWTSSDGHSASIESSPTDVPLPAPPFTPSDGHSASIESSPTEGRLIAQAGSQTTTAEAPPVSAEAESLDVERSLQAANQDKPEWVDAPNGRVDGVYRTKVTTDPLSSRRDCEQQLPELLQGETRAYIDSYLGEGASRLVQLPTSYIHERIVRNEWLQEKELTLGPMYILHVLLEFDDSARQDIRRWHDEALVTRRLTYTGTGAGLAMALLATLFGYLKLDTATRGYYTGRLRLAAGAMILAEAAIVAFLVRGGIGL